jgi:beta-lactamase class A
MKDAPRQNRFAVLLRYAAPASFGIIIGICVGWFIRTAEVPTASMVKTIRETSSQYPLVSQLLLISTPEDDAGEQYTPLTNILQSYIQNAKNNKEAEDVSVYVRDLNSNIWTGVNQNDKYSPASMLKIATLMAFLEQSESNPALLSDSVKIPASFPNNDSDQDYYPPPHPLSPGNTYTNAQLLTAMISSSDNNAVVWLDDELGPTPLNTIYTDLQMPQENSGGIDYMSPGLFSRLYRVLYNATYLSPELSEKTLEILTHTDFAQGIPSGVPASTTIAHKFGERTFTTSAGTVTGRELHDCGIVYYPNNPYFICVMTKGTSFPALEKIISDISALVWNQIVEIHQNSTPGQ